ncbi:hypothetical protein RCRUDOLPH_48 [Rhodobacter phage RcRudolph]|nr:hypothetical protein RCRUDOLPH_48 [Rhodobacter phage RcRudolph]
MARQEIAPPRIYKCTEHLFYGTIYWVNGDLPTKDRTLANDVKNPPNSGWSHAFLIDKGGKLVTLFCPFTLESFQVTRSCGELASMSMDRRYKPSAKNPMLNEQDGWQPWSKEREAKLLKIVLDNWAMAGRLSLPGKDYDVAAMVINMLGGEVPLRVIAEGAEPDKPRGGKEADVLGLLKPVKRESKRGKVLEFFLPQPRSIREAMAEFSTTRSNVLSHLFILQKDHGIGYTLTGDAASIQLPAGCTDPFAEGQ